MIGSKLKVVLAMVLVLMSGLALTGCKNENNNLQRQALQKHESKRYTLRGQVVAKDVAANEVTVQHDEIPGFMAAMTMPYKVKDPATVQEVKPGNKITAEVVVVNDGSDYWLEDVRSEDEMQGQALFELHCAPCHQDTHPDLRKQPRKLAGLFQSKSLLSGAPATNAQVRKTIIEGRGTMPAFDQRLSEEEVDDLVKYLHILK